MVGALRVALENRRAGADVARAERERARELGVTDGRGARTEHEKSARPRRADAVCGQAPHGVESATAGGAARSELRRIADHEVESALAPGMRERLVRVDALEAHAFVESVQPSALGADFERERARVDGLDGLGAPARRRQGDRADVRKRIEHTPAARERLDACAERPLVDVKSRLLSELERNAKAQAALDEVESIEARVAPDDAAGRHEALALRGALGGSVDDGAGAEPPERVEHGAARAASRRSCPFERTARRPGDRR